MNNIIEKLHNALQKIKSKLIQVNITISVTEKTVELTDKNQILAPLNLSFCDHKTQSLLVQINSQQPLIKAMHICQTHSASIVDLTAGFGRDSLILSTLNKPLISIEKNPITATVLRILVAQYQTINPCNWQVISGCSLFWLQQQSSNFSHFYLDPFFHKRKNALPKNDMQWLQKLGQIQTTDDNDKNVKDLFTTAYCHATTRIVVKRPKNAAYLHNKKPNQGSIYQKTSRFDCYKP